MSVFHRLYHRFWQFGGLTLVGEYIRLGAFGEFMKQGLLVLLKKKGISQAYADIQRKIVPHLRKQYAPLLKQLISEYSEKELTHQHSHRIWVCWFQGMENAPEIIRICQTSLRRYLKDREIIVLTDENISQYVTFPKHIQEKYQKGKIPMAHYSDLLRLEVLTRYGGTWIDATVLCTGFGTQKAPWREGGMIITDILDADLFFFQYYHQGNTRFSGISNWFISASSNQKSLLILKEMLYQYHKDYDCAMAYFIFHIFFMMIARQLPEEVEQMPRVSNKYCFALENHLGGHYDEVWMKQLTDNCCFHKLSGRLWKEAEGKSDTYLCKIKEMFDEN